MSEVVTESGLTVVLERSNRDMIANDNGPAGVVAPDAFGGSVMGQWGSNIPLPPMVPWEGWPVDWNMPTWNGVGLMFRVGTVMTCCDINSKQLASFPTYIMRGVDMLAPVSWQSNPEPEIYSGWDEFMKHAVNSFELRGEIFLWCTGRYANNQVARFVCVSPDRMSVLWEDGVIAYRMSGELLDPRDVCHIKYQAWPGYLRGMGPIEWTVANLVSAAALQNYGANLATRGGIPWAVIKTPRNLDGKQTTDLQNAWVNASARRNGAPAVLTGDLTLDVLSLSPQQMAMLDLRVFDEVRIAAAFGVPAWLLSLPEGGRSMVYKNVEQVYSGHWRGTLRPMAQAIASAISNWALPAGQRIEFDSDRYTEPEFADRAAAYSVMYNIFDPVTGERAMTIDEIRSKERFSVNADVGGDPVAVAVMSSVSS